MLPYLGFFLCIAHGSHLWRVAPVVCIRSLVKNSIVSSDGYVRFESVCSGHEQDSRKQMCGVLGMCKVQDEGLPDRVRGGGGAGALNASPGRLSCVSRVVCADDVEEVSARSAEPVFLGGSATCGWKARCMVGEWIDGSCWYRSFLRRFAN